ncbi:MAG: phosphotransferase [Caldilineaceae bacterium]
MKSDTSRIDRIALIRRLRDEYGLVIEQLTFVPKGEESYGYIATSTSGQRYFVKVHSFVEGYDEAQLEQLKRPYQVVYQLVNTHGLDYIVAPLPTRSGEVVTRFGDFTVAVFDYVVGDGLTLTAPQQQDWQQIGKLIAALHSDTRKLLTTRHSLADIPEEPFAIGFKSWLLDVLAATEQKLRINDDIRQQAWQLLKHEKDLVLQCLLRAEKLADKAQQQSYNPALTHGDLAYENILALSDGRLVIIDWGKLLKAPVERDLLDFWGANFEKVVTYYLINCDPMPELHSEILDYYLARNQLVQIADYGSWLLLEDAAPEDLDHAWAQLQKLFPLQSYDCSELLQRIQAKIEKH